MTADEAIVGTSRSNPRPRLAVLIPVHNNQRGFERSLNSLCQDVTAAFDVVVADDGSEPPLELIERLPFSVVLLRLPHNRGIGAALNAGLARIAAEGYEYVARLDAGDISLPGRFAAQVAFLDRHPDHGVVGTYSQQVDINGRFLFVFRPPTVHDQLVRFQRYRIGLIHPSVMLRMRALLEVGFYSESYQGAEDYELFMRLSRVYKLANLPHVYLTVEINPQSLSARRFRHGLRRLQVLGRHFAPFSIHSYLGIVRNFMLLFVTRQLVLQLKKVHARWSSA
jgi:glycosyltransferase involved in cell wall biosynthesis